MESNIEMIGACGINCGDCDIRLAGTNHEIAERLAKGFSEKGIIPDATPDMFRCDGCRGDRENHWSADCFILQCCVDDKGYDYCNRCPDFACDKLVEWSNQNERYVKALNRLREMAGK
ncbi:MAG: DUF3795 domain-containing protein [Dehalococcoidales bacterium]|nr:DUF3795 domain-containing protein [Dehalococcoidales bacterium]